jgi:hopanoid biosynthesis associated protein HpnK
VRGLIVTADDFGAAAEVNGAVEQGFREGALTAASLMVGAPAAAEAVAIAKANPGLRVGLHLVLVEGRPTLAAERVPDLVDEAGYFRTDMARAGAAMFFLPHVRRQLADEVGAQFAAFGATGLPFDHVNAHKHFHMHPTIAGLLIGMARRYGVAGARAPLEPYDVLGAIEPGPPSGVERLVAPFARVVARRFRSAGFVVPDQVFGLRWSGAMTPHRLSALIERMPEGLTEIYLHPARSGGFAGAAAHYLYAEELAALLAPETLAAIRRPEIRRGGFADFSSRSGALSQGAA